LLITHREEVGRSRRQRVALRARRIAPRRRVGAVAIAAALGCAAVILLVPILHLGTLLLVLVAAGSTATFVWDRFRLSEVEQDLREARVHAADVIDLERQRIQRDLHDSAQQRVVSVRIRLGILASRHATDGSDTIAELGRELEMALAEIRDVTRDGSPRLLLQAGVTDALRALAAHAPLPVTVESRAFGRYEPQLERNVYFACAEALQNAAKHAGPKARARIRLTGDRRRVEFTVEDSGVGFDPARVPIGMGLTNLSDRVLGLGGRLTIDSQPGFGTRVHGEIPITIPGG
jgi:signal transduction histidine kinase